MSKHLRKEIQMTNKHEKKKLAFTVTEKILIQMSANLSLLNLAKSKNKQTKKQNKTKQKPHAKLARALEQHLWDFAGKSRSKPSGQSLVKC